MRIKLWCSNVQNTISSLWLNLRNRKHVPCFYRVMQTQVEVWENEKCCGNTSRRWVFPQLFQVLPNFYECLYNSIETRSTCFLFLFENNATRKRKTPLQLVNFDYQNVKPRPNDRNMPTQHVATLLGATCYVRLATVLRCVATCWVLLTQLWPASNLSQQHATCRNRVAKRAQHVAPNNVGICCAECCDRLTSA